MRTASQTNSWEYLIPGWSQLLQIRDVLQGNASYVGGLDRIFGVGTKGSSSDLTGQALSISQTARDEYLADREHTEMREDTAYQRAVEDMKKAGLNPFTVGASPASSAASSVGADTLTNKLQVLGYVLDLKNLDAKNRQITNNLITGLLKAK